MRRAWPASILVAGTMLSAPGASLPAQAGDRLEGQMTKITVDLQDGFMDDTVAVSAGGREVVREQGVTTRFQIGMARSLQVAVPEDAEVLEVEVPTKNARATVAIDTSKPVFVGVSLTTEGELEIRVQEQLFGYM
jgi:hypothetical protein